MIEADNVTSSPRMGGLVRRYHTWPTIQVQNVGEHTFHVLRIYWSAFGEVPAEVCAYLLHHDISEVKVGDPPHPIKLDNPPLKQIYDDMEDAALVSMVGFSRAQHILGNVSDHQRVRMKACDLVEMAEFAMVERALGNRFADAIVANVDRALGMLALSEHDRECIVEYYTTEILRFEE